MYNLVIMKALVLSESEPKFTVKQLRFLKYYLATGNGSEAAMKAYSCKNRAVASVVSSQNLVKLKEPLKLLMESRGIDIGNLLEVLENGLKAKKIVGTKDDFVEVDDHQTRHKYLETAARWLGIEAKSIEKATLNTNTFNFFSTPKDVREDFNSKFEGFLRNFYYKHT